MVLDCSWGSEGCIDIRIREQVESSHRHSHILNCVHQAGTRKAASSNWRV